MQHSSVLLYLTLMLLVTFTGAAWSQVTVSRMTQPKLLPVETTAADIMAQVQAEKDKLFFLNSYWSAGKVGVQFDDFLITNGAYAQLESTWTEVLGSDGTNLLRLPSEQDNKRYSSDQDRIYIYTKESKARPVSARGTVLLHVPYKFSRISLTAEDISITRNVGALSATLRRCEGQMAQIYLTGDLDKAKRIMVFRDAAGRQLEPVRYEGSRNENGIEYTYTMRGTIAQIEIMMPAEYAKITLDVNAIVEPTVVPDQPFPATTRYVAPGIPAEPDEFTRETLLQQCMIAAQPSRWEMGSLNDPQISVVLPNVVNSAYATVDFGKPRLLDTAGNEIPYRMQRYDFDPSTCTFSISIQKEGKTRLLEFTRVVGSVTIRYPVVMGVATLTPAEPHIGAFTAHFTPPYVGVNGLDRDMLARNLFRCPEGAPVRAFDATGRQLRALPYFKSYSRNNEHWQFYSFWGSPTEIRVYHIAHWFTVEIPYEFPGSIRSIGDSLL